MIPIEPLDIKSHIPEMPDLDEIINDIINFFNSTPVLPLPLEERFDGAGVYALYYKGEFDLYKPITEANSSKFVQPIYVGKAVPKGWIKGRTKKTKEE